MHSSHTLLVAASLVAASSLSFTPLAAQDQGVRGEPLPPSAISPLVRETMDVVLERERLNPPDTRVRGVWNGEAGRWFVPPVGAAPRAHSGEKAIVNEWGDPRMAIVFSGAVDVSDVWVNGHGPTAATAVRFVGTRLGVEVGATTWLPLGPDMMRAALQFDAIDRLVVEVQPATGRQGWIALDDLTFAPAGAAGMARTLDFEDLAWRTVLTGTQYAGLAWEAGTGLGGVAADGAGVVHAPVQSAPEADAIGGEAWLAPSAVGATSPSIWDNIATARQGDAGANLIPPDTCGAAGRDHFVSITNSNLSVYSKATGVRSINVSLTNFYPGASGTVGDPRIVWDSNHSRFIALATNFSGSATVYVAITETADPNGAWFKFSFQTNVGVNAGKWPDYPTLGVDARGLYTSAYMVGGSASMTIWAIDKAPLVTNPPSLGTITAFTSLPYEGALQPCDTYGDPGSEYLLSRNSSTRLRVRRVAPPMTAPTLIDVGFASIPSHSSPVTIPALGSTTNLNAIDTRIMNAVYRNGSVWGIHNISVGGRGVVRWYQVNATTAALQQTGTLSDPLWHYFFGAIAVDAQNNVGIGLSGAHAASYAGAFFAGRLASDPAGMTSDPVLYKAGEGPWNRTDGSGRNRYGDYSYTNVDPVDDVGFWTIQEYILPGNNWGTRAARIGYEAYNYGDGLAGTASVPGLAAMARPVIGTNLTLQIGNSHGGASVPGLFMAGVSPTSVSIFGGTLLVVPLVAEPISVANPMGTLVIGVPNQLGLVGVPVYFQIAESDAGAAQGVSFTPGLVVRPGTR